MVDLGLIDFDSLDDLIVEDECIEDFLDAPKEEIVLDDEDLLLDFEDEELIDLSSTPIEKRKDNLGWESTERATKNIYGLVYFKPKQAPKPQIDKPIPIEEKEETKEPPKEKPQQQPIHNITGYIENEHLNLIPLELYLSEVDEEPYTFYFIMRNFKKELEELGIDVDSKENRATLLWVYPEMIPVTNQLVANKILNFLTENKTKGFPIINKGHSPLLKRKGDAISRQLYAWITLK